MTTSRPKAPSNLKERIAALQQRNVSPTSHSSAQTPTIPAGSGLRDKIAKFESKGGTPVPRGSFGMNVPPAEGVQVKRRGELYGNRIPSVPGVQPGSRLAMHHTGSGLNYAVVPPAGEKRRFSMSAELNLPPFDPTAGPSSPSNAFNDLPLTPGSSDFEHTALSEKDVEVLMFSGPSEANDRDRPAQVDAGIEYTAQSLPPPILITPEDLVASTTTPSDKTFAEKLSLPLEEASTDVELSARSIEVALNFDRSNGDDLSSADKISEKTFATTASVPEFLLQGPEKSKDQPEDLSISSDSTAPSPMQADTPDSFMAEKPLDSAECANVPDSREHVKPNDGLAQPNDAPAQPPPVLEHTPTNEALSPPFLQTGVENVVIGISEDDISSSDVSLTGDHSSSETDVDVFTDSHSDDHTQRPENLVMDDEEVFALEEDTTPRPTPSSSSANLVDSPPIELAYTPSPPPTPGLSSSPTTLNSSRPVSMIETTIDEHRSSDTGPAVPVYSQRSYQPKSDFSTTDDSNHSTAHAKSLSQSHPKYVEPDLKSHSEAKPHTFSVVVHGKVPDAKFTASKALPSTPQISRVRKTAVPDTPLSPGYRDLAQLVQETARLEELLADDTSPSEVPSVASTVEEESLSIPDEIPSKFDLATLAARPIKKKRSLKNPLGRSKSITDTMPELPLPPPPPPVPNTNTNNSVGAKRSIARDLVNARSTASSPPPLSQHSRSTSPPTAPSLLSVAGTIDDLPPSPPPKSSTSKYFSSLRRLGSHSTHQRLATTPRHNSASSLVSSEDSPQLVTPVDDSVDFAARQATRAASVYGWPSASPKKVMSGSMLRASSFAEKMWHRTRTRSDVSSTDAPGTVHSLRFDERHSKANYSDIDDASDTRSSYLPSELGVLPSLNSIVLSDAEDEMNNEDTTLLTHPPSRSSSLPSPPRLEVSFTPSQNPDSSMVSTLSSSSSIAPSPLFDMAFFDSFPPVPESIPQSKLGFSMDAGARE